MAHLIQINDSVEHTLTTKDLASAHIIKNNDGSYNMLIDNQSLNISIVEISEDAKTAKIKINNQIYTYQIKTPLDQIVDKMGFSTLDFEDQKELKSPMPGIILSLPIHVGMEVEVDTPLLILEAMKMENVIKAKSKQIVKEIHVKVGEAVNKNALLITFE